LRQRNNDTQLLIVEKIAQLVLLVEMNTKSGFHFD
jgi:hypothetical protein